MRRARGLGISSSSTTSSAPRKRRCLTCTSATGSMAPRACSTRSAIARSSASGPPDGSALPRTSSPRSSPRPQSPGATMSCPSTAAARTAPRADRVSTSSPDPALARVLRSLTALAVCSSLVCSPLAAQDTTAEPTLEDLIPDAAVADPETWAQQGVPPEEAAAAEQAVEELAADSPLAEVPQIDIPWPDDVELPQLAPLEPETDIEFADFDLELPQVDMGGEERISDELVLVFPTDRALFPHHDEFLDRFKALSTIEELDDDDNAARLAAQARADEDL